MTEPTIGLMAIISTLSLYSPLPPSYTNATNAAGRAAFIQSGGQAIQDKILAYSENKAHKTLNSLGVTDNQMAIVVGTVKVIREQRISFPGPKFDRIRTNLAVTPNSGFVGLEYGL
jgi:hypothetical protein